MMYPGVQTNNWAGVGFQGPQFNNAIFPPKKENPVNQWAAKKMLNSMNYAAPMNQQGVTAAYTNAIKPAQEVIDRQKRVVGLVNGAKVAPLSDIQGNMLVNEIGSSMSEYEALTPKHQRLLNYMDTIGEKDAGMISYYMFKDVFGIKQFKNDYFKKDFEWCTIFGSPLDWAYMDPNVERDFSQSTPMKFLVNHKAIMTRIERTKGFYTKDSWLNFITKVVYTNEMDYF